MDTQYDKKKFEAAFQLITAVSNQIIRIDFKEMARWINNLLSPKTVESSPDYDEQTAKNLQDLMAVMNQFQTMKDSLFQHGIPIRNIEHYRKEHSTKDYSGDDGIIGQSPSGLAAKE
jgi:hypothetical protein